MFGKTTPELWKRARPLVVLVASVLSLTVIKLTGDWLNSLHYLDGVNKVFGAQRYTAFDYCLNSDPTLLWMYWVVNMITFFSDTILGVSLLINRSKVERFLRFVYYHPPAVLLFGATFVGNGLNHFTETLTMNIGVYYLDVIVSTATAFTALTAAVFVVWSFYGPHNLPQINEGEEMADKLNPRASSINK